MPVHSSRELFLELRQSADKHLQDARCARAELAEIRAHTIEAISQSRELMASVDALLTLPYVRHRS
jgi:hypothetical protein